MLAREASEMILPKMTIGLGAGSTVMRVVEVLAERSLDSVTVIVASLATQKYCWDHGIEADLMVACSHIDLYIDGADEVDETWCLLKGRGGAMTGEKLCAHMAKRFLVLVDDSKCVTSLGQRWPVVAVEVVPWARSSVARAVVKMGGRPHWRETKSDMGNDIIDCYDLNLAKPYELSREINQMTGVVGHGIFVNDKPQAVKVSDGDKVWDMRRI